MAAEFFGAIKAMTAFSRLWRASKGGTANIDSIYRNIMARAAYNLVRIPKLLARQVA